MSDEANGSARYAWYSLAVLVLAYILAFLDRQILNLLVEPIKHDLHLSDVQISLLQGLSFALFLSFGGIPIGRLIDTRRRTSLLAVCIAFWSIAAAGCGLARGYGQLLLCRIGVGIGEAAMTPAAYSLIGDYFTTARQGLAMALYSVGAYIGAGLALIIGAGIAARVPSGSVLVPLIGSLHGWQLVFLLAGIPGLAVALLVSTLREPRRVDSDAVPPTLTDVAVFFRSRARPLILVNLAVAFAAVAMYGLSAWLPTFFHRRFGMAATDAGHMLGLIIMTAGSAGTLSAGYLGDRLTRAGWSDGRLRVMLTGAALAAPCALAAMLADDPDTVFALLVPTLYFVTLAIGSGPATLQLVTPRLMRGVQHAFAVLAVNLIGLGLGPTIVAVITDHVLHDETKLGLALAMTAPTALLVSATCAISALRPYRKALAGPVA